MDFDEMFKDFDPTEFFLKETQPLEKHDPEAGKVLQYLYNSKSEALKHRLGTLINAIFTQNIQTFMISRRSLSNLYKDDELSKYKALPAKDYSIFLGKLANSKLFTVLRKPTSSKAGVYKLTDPELVEVLIRLVGKKTLEAQERKALEYYDQEKVDFKELADKTRKSLTERLNRELKGGKQS